MSMAYCMQGAVQRHHVVVKCKRQSCALTIPSGFDELPRINIVVDCPICGELRRYRPSEAFMGTPDMLCFRKPVQPVRLRKKEGFRKA